MKTRHIARGIGSVIALVSAIGAVGCSSEPLSPEEAAEIGESAQAINLSLTASPYVSKFSSYFRLSDGNRILVAGGYDASGAAIRSTYIFDKTGNSGAGSWTQQDDMPNGLERGEAAIIPIPGETDKFLVAGGRSSEGGTVLQDSLIFDAVNNDWIQLASPNMSVARTNFSLSACGTSGTKVIAIGGHTSNSAIDYFTKGSPLSASTWTALDDGASGTEKLTQQRLFPKVVGLPSSPLTKLLITGGDDTSNVRNTAEILTVNSTCTQKSAHANTGNNMPGARTEHAAAPISLSLTISGVTRTYDVLVTAGTSNFSDNPTATFVYDETDNTWQTASTLALAAGRVRPEVVIESASKFAIVGGYAASTGFSVNLVDEFNSGTRSALGPMDFARTGPFAGYLNSTLIAGMGEEIDASPVLLTDVE